MAKKADPVPLDWIPPTLGITLALTLAIGIGFLIGQQTPPAPDDMSAICRKLPEAIKSSDCIALRSAVAAEAATSISRWALWLSFGTLLASTMALIGLIIAFRQGQRTIALATDANRIAMENGQAQARAYVVVQAVECKLGADGRLTTRVKFQNSGLSPARRLRWLYNARLAVEHGEARRQTVTIGDEPDLEKSHWRQDIPSGKTWTSSPLSLRRIDDAALAAPIEKAVFIAVTVKIVADYQDVFGIVHRENACFQGRLNVGQDERDYAALERANDLVFDEPASKLPAGPPQISSGV